MVRFTMSCAMVLAGLAPALAAPMGTVNSFTHAEDARARAAIIAAGYHPEVLTMAQADNLFYTATKNGEDYQITVTPSDKVFASTGLPEQAGNSTSG
jgi:hypothetical protein